MKLVEKINDYNDKQFFNIIENRRELKEYLRYALADAKLCGDNPKIWEDEDRSIFIYYKDGSCRNLSEGEKITNFKYFNIDKMIENNTESYVLFGEIEIIKSSYGDYEIQYNF